MREMLREQIGGRIAGMRFRATFALCFALALPTWGQHQGSHGGGGSVGHGGGGGRPSAPGHGGSSGYRGSPAQAPSYAGMVGLRAQSSFSAPGLSPLPSRLQPPPRAGVPLPYRGNGFSGGYGGGSDHRGRHGHREPYRGREHDRRFRGRGSYGYGYAYAYPYVVDPGFYDWGSTDYSENEQGQDEGAPQEQGSEYGPEQPGPGYGDAPYPQQQEYSQPVPPPTVGPQRQEYHFAASPSAPSPITTKPLTVIFKGGRAPEKIQNYMVTSSALTNLDGEHFEKIPLDQIDVAATQQANRSSGIDFQVPAPSHD